MKTFSRWATRFQYLSLVILTVVFTSCSLFKSSTKPGVETTEPAFEIPKPKIGHDKPLEISRRPDDVNLCLRVNDAINQSEFKKARWGLVAISLVDGRVICGRDAQKLFNPASIQKLLTSIVALDKLGGDYQTKTSIYATREFDNGVLKGDLILYGRGAPDFDTEKLSSLVNLVKLKGLRKIEGDVIGDESYFKGDGLGDGWTWNEAQWYYGAAASALSINKNLVTVTIENGKPRADANFVELSGEVEPIEDIEAIGVKRELGTNKIYVWGNGKNLDARIAINNPALLAAKILKETLEKNGIEVSGEVRSADWKSSDKLDPEKAIEIANLASQPLAETIREMNKDSVNLYAELILRILGKKFGSEAPDENPKMQKLRGDDSAGASVVEKWLVDQNITTMDVAIHDGSGLSRLDFVTPEAIGRALIFAAKSEFAANFKNSLPVAGKSGTLRGRLRNVSGRILAKTGSITYVSSLAGYAKSENDTVAFVIVSNNETRKAESSAVIDKIAAILAGN